MEEKIQGWFETPFYHNVYQNYDLTVDEVLLFGLIFNTTALNQRSFFYTNKALAQKWKTTVRTIQRRIEKLTNVGLLTIDIEKSKDGTYRSISLTDEGVTSITPSNTKCHAGGDTDDIRGVTPVSYQNKTKQNKTKQINNNTSNEVLDRTKKQAVIPVLDSAQKEKNSAKKEKGIHPEVEKMLILIKEALGLSDFKESKDSQIKAGGAIVGLFNDIGGIEFQKRFKALASDSFHSKNMGSLWYIHRNMKGFVDRSNIKIQQESNVAIYD